MEFDEKKVYIITLIDTAVSKYTSNLEINYYTNSILGYFENGIFYGIQNGNRIDNLFVGKIVLGNSINLLSFSPNSSFEFEYSGVYDKSKSCITGFIRSFGNMSKIAESEIAKQYCRSMFTLKSIEEEEKFGQNDYFPTIIHNNFPCRIPINNFNRLKEHCEILKSLLICKNKSLYEEYIQLIMDEKYPDSNKIRLMLEINNLIYELNIKRKILTLDENEQTQLEIQKGQLTYFI